MRILVVTPPPLKPSEPGLSGGAAAARLRDLGADARWVDASLEWHRFALDPGRLRATLAGPGLAVPDGRRRAFGRAVRRLGVPVHPLRRLETYRHRETYTSAIDDLENALAVVALPHAGWRLGIARVAFAGPARRLESSAALARAAGSPGPFDAYFRSVLLPRIERDGIASVAVSLTFQEQAPAAFRLATLLAQALPDVRRVLGGPLPACWLAAGITLDRPPFDRFDDVAAGTDADLARLAGADAPPSLPDAPLAVPLDDVPWADCLAPMPIVPAALGRGCYWRRCTFCPDGRHPRHDPCSPPGITRWLRSVADRFPDGAMLHLTDSALPPALLAGVAETIRAEKLPLAWHGFVRVETAFSDPAFAGHLAAGGCALLQFGVESASPRLLDAMGKGSDPAAARGALRAAAGAGIRTQVHLLFGLPTETDDDREATLAFVTGEAEAIGSVSPALLNLPKGSPMHRRPEAFGITALSPLGADTDLSLYDGFRCGDSHPRVEARRWLARRFFKSDALRAIRSRLRAPFKANHLCFLP
jgi:hypothetical protein